MRVIQRSDMIDMAAVRAKGREGGTPAACGRLRVGEAPEGTVRAGCLEAPARGPVSRFSTRISTVFLPISAPLTLPSRAD